MSRVESESMEDGFQEDYTDQPGRHTHTIRKKNVKGQKRTAGKYTDVEENNNQVDELCKELGGMGCIVDSVKKPPNTCVETCIYEEDDGEAKNKPETSNEADYLEDDFEEPSDDDEQFSGIKVSEKARDVKSKSHSSLSNRGAMSTHSRASTGYGSLTVPKTNRINMSFSNDRLRDIERQNHILLNKIMKASNKGSSIPPEGAPKRPTPSAALRRKQQQKQIDHDNMILLRKIQRAKSSSLSMRR